MAIFHDTITIPARGDITVGGLMGTRVEFDNEPKPSIFGPEFDKMAEEFRQRHVDPAGRGAYYVGLVTRTKL